MKDSYFLTTHDFNLVELKKLLFLGLNAEARLARDLDPIEEFSVALKNHKGSLVGGVSGFSYYGCLHIDMLWIDSSLRKKGWGIKLMQQAETIGIERKCSFSTVNTMDWEASLFYQKLGYEVEFIRKGFQKDSIMIFLRKTLIL